MGAPSPRYAAEFKQKAVELYKKSGTAYAEVARRPGCDAGGLSDWVKKADAAECGAGDDPFQIAEGLRGLKRENERLKRENEMLLKASAFFAGRQLQESRRRGRSSSSFSSTKAGGRSRRCAPRSGRPAGATARGRAGRRARTRCATGARRIDHLGQKRGARHIRRAQDLLHAEADGAASRACAKRPSGEKRAARRGGRSKTWSSASSAPTAPTWRGSPTSLA